MNETNKSLKTNPFAKQTHKATRLSNCKAKGSKLKPSVELQTRVF